MKRLKNSFLVWPVAIGLVVAIIVGQTQAPAFAAPQRGLTSESSGSECQVAKSFATALDDFSTQSAALNSKSEVSQTEIRRLQASANRLKDNVGKTVNAAQANITRQRQAGKWTPEFDASIEKDLSQLELDANTKSSLINWLKQKGGARALMEDAVSQLKVANVEIDKTVNGIKAKTIRTGLNVAPEFRSVAFHSSPVIKNVLACAGWFLVFAIANACGAKKIADYAVGKILENCF